MNITRRNFLKTGAAAVAGFTIAPNTILGSSHGHMAPSDTPNIAAVGVGSQGGGDIQNIADPDEKIGRRPNPDRQYGGWVSPNFAGLAPERRMVNQAVQMGDAGKQPIHHANMYALCDVDLDYAGHIMAGYPKAKKYQDFRKMLDEWTSKHVKVIVGYASALSEICKFIDRTGYDVSRMSVRSIIPISEAMPAGIRERLAELFDCPVQSWYSNEENGIMGIQPRDGDSYYIDTANYYYEILKLDSDEPAAPGELGRIVITDLNNRAMPMLRYDNGDLASYELTDYGTRYRLVLKELYGRRSDIIYDTKGGALTPFVITNNLWDVEGVRQFQFIQTDVKNYTVRLNADKEKIDEADIMRRIGHYFGDDAVFTIEYVDEIPVLNSGKRKYIMNLCEKYK